jgi:hypothetical protein
MNTHFEVTIEDRNGYPTIDFNGRCNYIKDIFGDFIAFMNRDEKEKEILLRIIHKDKIVQIRNIGTEN